MIWIFDTRASMFGLCNGCIPILVSLIHKSWLTKTTIIKHGIMIFKLCSLFDWLEKQLQNDGFSKFKLLHHDVKLHSLLIYLYSKSFSTQCFETDYQYISLIWSCNNKKGWSKYWIQNPWILNRPLLNCSITCTFAYNLEALKLEFCILISL